MSDVLLLDDKQRILVDLGARLIDAGYKVHPTDNASLAERIVKTETLDFAVVDLKIGHRSEQGGLDFIQFLRRNQPRTRVIVLSSYSPQSVDTTGVEIDAWVSKIDPEDNYITLVIRCLQRFTTQPPRKRCFVIMPLSTSSSCRQDQWREVFARMIQPAVEACHFECHRSEGVAGNIIKLILHDLNRADLVVADLTDRNPNVFYELGVRHALRDSTILIAQSLEHVPFDLRPYSVIVYDWTTEEGRQLFAARLRKALQEFAARPATAVSPVQEYLHVAPNGMAQGTDAAPL